jgi:hypothetical protein
MEENSLLLAFIPATFEEDGSLFQHYYVIAATGSFIALHGVYVFGYFPLQQILLRWGRFGNAINHTMNHDLENKKQLLSFK